jgi:RNA polymerase sigma factor (TIGR02999 family)
MEGVSKSDVTGLLRAWRGGSRDALEQLIPKVYQELRRIAQRYVSRERSGLTLQATALVNEAYLRLVNIREVAWQDRAHFFAVCSELMRRVLVDYARARLFKKRGGGSNNIALDENSALAPMRAEELLDVDRALTALSEVDPRKARMVEMRFFAGLSAEEVAAVLDVSIQTVHRDWKISKAWLTRHMNRTASS